ncbi:MAG: Hsp70 family protein, partial [Candidatus Saccharibacteria bacterium]|nr:Hsp70 family protein [Candidatus Saccharibacteria bacterium]
MAKNNIDNSVIRVGIDLGTTNSEIAICPSGNVEIIKNSLSDEFTPSVFGYDKLGNKIVGKHALKKIASFREEDIDNVKREVKRLMGTGEKVGFSYAGKKMLPEEISAEILKTLRDDALRNNPDINLKSAIITVPAYFDSVQNEATVRAGNLAGFEQVTLLQEPIAAAMAYGFNRSIDANWLVYDFGGGTFDVALISSTDGMLKVIEHGGNNFLGGKDIDAAIVDEVIKPELLSRYKIKSFSKVVDEKLKVIAEDAKKMLTGSNEVSIEVDNIGEDDSGEEIYASLTLDRARFNSIIKPIIDKTIEIAKEVIEKSSIKAGSVSKIILVGGPTQIPYLRERLSEEMRIELETSIDPLTIVARGACIYGLGQRVSEDIVVEEYTNNSNEAYRVELNYEAMTSNDSEVLTGTITGLPQGEYYVRINSEDGNYNSTTITVKKNGSFYDSLIIAPGKANRFWIYLTDVNGNNVPIYPDNFTITHGLTVRGVPIPHGIGVIYGKKTSSGDFVEACDEYFARGDILPLENTKSYTTIRPLHKNGDNELPIEVYEGDYVEPRSNKIITNVLIDGSKLPHDLPKGTDLDLTITISQSREVGVEVYIPSVDVELNARVMI